MVHNALAMLIHKTRPLLKHPDAPVSYFYQSADNSRWAVLVTRIPDQEVVAA